MTRSKIVIRIERGIYIVEFTVDAVDIFIMSLLYKEIYLDCFLIFFPSIEIGPPVYYGIPKTKRKREKGTEWTNEGEPLIESQESPDAAGVSSFVCWR